jgi:hypothetical protein
MSKNFKRPPPAWWKFWLVAALLMSISIGFSTFYDQRPWPNDTTALLVLSTASIIGYMALGWRRLRAEIGSRGDGSWPGADKVKEILTGPKLLRWAWIVATIAVVIGALFYRKSQ